MSKRFTNTEKWEDPWYRSLKPEEKLMFNYLCDKCNQAGFYEIDIAMASFQTGLNHEQIEGAIKGLNRGLVGAGNWIWIKNFLRHQKNLPLNPANSFHKHIIECLKSQKENFNLKEIEEYLGAVQGLISPIVIGKGNGEGKGTKGVQGEIKLPENLKPIFEKWMHYRAEIKKPIKLPSLDAACKEFETLCNGDPLLAEKIINRSIANSWQGLFHLDKQGKKADPGTEQVGKKDYTATKF